MEAKSCSRSQGQPTTGVRSRTMIAMRSRISLLGRMLVMSRRSGLCRGFQMSEIAAGFNPVAHTLFQGAHVGKSAVALPLPDERAVDLDAESAAGRRDQRN